MSNKINLAILFGGKSAEHEISLLSARNVALSVDKEKYRVILVGIEKNGEWYLHDPELFSKQGNDSLVLRNITAKKRIIILPGNNVQQCVFQADNNKELIIDVVFPVLHGTCGEDGTVQGLLKLLNVPFVGAGVLGSAVGMDKDVMKRLLQDSRIPIPRFLVFHENANVDFEKVKAAVGLPFFIKPCNLGSSVGISKVTTESRFSGALAEAFQYDRKIMIEENITGRELECSVMGNLEPVASLPGEILTKDTFYTYNAKYIDGTATDLKMPAELPQAITNRVKEIAVKSYKVLCCEGLARMDFFLTKDNQVLVNEINTLPGFTNISMFTKLWSLDGINGAALTDKLITFALERFAAEQKLKTTFE